MSKKDEALKLALKKAFDLGKRYWQQANSDFTSQWRKSDVTLASFNQLVEDTIRDALAEQPAQQQEPVAWISDSPTKGNGKQLHWTKAEAWRWSSNITPLYTAPVHPIDTSEKRVDETAKDEHEPDAYGDGNVYCGQRSKDSETKTLHYTEPLRNSWFKLTDAEVWDEWVRAVDESNRSNRELAFRFARAIEAKLKGKNT